MAFHTYIDILRRFPIHRIGARKMSIKMVLMTAVIAAATVAVVMRVEPLRKLVMA